MLPNLGATQRICLEPSTSELAVTSATRPGRAIIADAAVSSQRANPTWSPREAQSNNDTTRVIDSCISTAAAAVGGDKPEEQSISRNSGTRIYDAAASAKSYCSCLSIDMQQGRKETGAEAFSSRARSRRGRSGSPHIHVRGPCAQYQRTASAQTRRTLTVRLAAANGVSTQDKTMARQPQRGIIRTKRTSVTIAKNTFPPPPRPARLRIQCCSTRVSCLGRSMNR